MSTYETAENKFVTIDGAKIAYRLFGASQGIPLVMHIHFRGNMDWWDPAFINPLAAKRPILLVDNAGVGRSEGTVPESYRGWAKVVIDVVKARNIPKVDVLGFSMGGFAALNMTLDAPDLVRKLIIAGSGPSQGEGTVSADPQYIMQLATAETEEQHHAGFLRTFFSWSDKKQKIGEDWWTRMTNARSDRQPALSGPGVAAQIAAVQRYMGGEYREEASYDRLDQIKIPVLVANGSNDLLVPTENSIVLWKKLVNAEAHLHLYADSGHGFLDEYHDHFSRLVNDFLDDE